MEACISNIFFTGFCGTVELWLCHSLVRSETVAAKRIYHAKIRVSTDLNCIYIPVRKGTHPGISERKKCVFHAL